MCHEHGFAQVTIAEEPVSAERVEAERRRTPGRGRPRLPPRARGTCRRPGLSRAALRRACGRHEVGGMPCGVALDLGAEVVGPVRGRHFHDMSEDVRGVAVLLTWASRKSSSTTEKSGIAKSSGNVGSHSPMPWTDSTRPAEPRPLECPAELRQRQRVRAVRRRCHGEPPLENLHAVPRQCTGELVGGFAQTSAPCCSTATASSFSRAHTSRD